MYIYIQIICISMYLAVFKESLKIEKLSWERCLVQSMKKKKII